MRYLAKNPKANLAINRRLVTAALGRARYLVPCLGQYVAQPSELDVAAGALYALPVNGRGNQFVALASIKREMPESLSFYWSTRPGGKA